MDDKDLPEEGDLMYEKVTPPSCSKAGSFERIYSTSPENHFPAL
jgi:hypothetical protein